MLTASSHTLRPLGDATSLAEAPVERLNDIAPVQRSDAWVRALIFAVILAEMLLFVQHARREYIWAIPTAHDQVGYLNDTYALLEASRTRGVASAMGEFISRRSPTGNLLQPIACIWFAFLGPGRLQALLLNFAFFGLFQLTFAYTLRWMTRSWWPALAGIGLTLSIQTPFLATGGAFDFRIDFIAMCLFGIFLCAAIRSHCFLDWRWSVIAGLVASLLVYFRTLTAVYISLFLALTGLVLATTWASQRLRIAHQRDWGDSIGVDARVRRRFGGMLVLGSILAVTAGPFLYYLRKAIHDYYVVGHLTSSEKEIRAAEQGVHDLLTNLLFYPQSIFTYHAGPHFWLLAGGVAIVALICLLTLRSRRSFDASSGQNGVLKSVAILASLAIAAPLIPLTANYAKSPVVGNIAIPGLICLAILPLLVITPRLHRHRGVLTALCIMVFGLGAVTQFSRAMAMSDLSRSRGDFERAAELQRTLSNTVVEMGLGDARIFSDSNLSHLDPMTGCVWHYENHGALPKMHRLSHTIFAEDEEACRVKLRQADFVVVGGADAASHYPYDVAMSRLGPEIRRYCERYLCRAFVGTIFNQEISLYYRCRPLAINGLTPDGWITNQGLDLRFRADDLKDCQSIEIQQGEIKSLLTRSPEVTAELWLEGKRLRTLPARVEGLLDAIVIGWTPLEATSTTFVTIRIRFSDSFCPKELGLNNDPRRLVMNVPGQEYIVVNRRN